MPYVNPNRREMKKVMVPLTLAEKRLFEVYARRHPEFRSWCWAARDLLVRALRAELRDMEIG